MSKTKSKNRTSNHRGRVGNAKHNEHNFYDSDEKNSFVFSVTENKILEKDLEQSELKFYNRYAKFLAEQNEKHIAKYNYNRVKTLEQFYECKRYKPIEEIMQYGNVDSEIPSEEDFNKMIADYVQWKCDWSESHGNHLHILNYANHFDEATHHSHVRGIWDYTDENGIIRIGQEEAMKQAGIELPEPNKPTDRKNTRVMTWTKMCRDKWNDICEQYGYAVERVPLPPRKGKSIRAYRAQKEQELKTREDNINTRETLVQAKQAELNTKEADLLTRETELQTKEAYLRERYLKLKKAETLETARAEELNTREIELNDQEKRLASKYRQLDTLLVKTEELNNRALRYVEAAEREYHIQQNKAKAKITSEIKEVKSYRENVMNNPEVRKIMNKWADENNSVADEKDDFQNY